MQNKRIFSILLLMLAPSQLVYGSSFDGMQQWLSQMIVGLRSSVGSCSIPLVRRRTGLNCSIALCSQPFTLHDIGTMVMNTLKDVGEDLQFVAFILRHMLNGVTYYVQEKPVNAVIIGSSCFLGVLLARSVLRKIVGPSKCHACRSRHQ